MLVDADFNIYIIDSSRAFRYRHELRSEDSLRQFSRSLLDRLEILTPELLGEHLGGWLTPVQIEALLARRDRIVELAASRVADQGAAAVIYP